MQNRLLYSNWLLYRYGCVVSWQVLSGCAIIVRGQPRGGPPPERQINLSNIRAGAMARRAAQSQPDTKDTPDEVSGAIQEECVCECFGIWDKLPLKTALVKYNRVLVLAASMCALRGVYRDLLYPSHQQRTLCLDFLSQWFVILFLQSNCNISTVLK